MKTTAVIEKGKDGRFGIFTPDIEHVIIGEGASVAEAKADFENSLAEMIASYTEDGGELPDELRDIEFEYKYDIASVFNFFDFINVSKFARWAGVNAGLMRQYKSCNTYISETQVRKIETALHNIGRELTAISL
ncbi:MAG: type II toxin-antitoxin system HicB family antitoxin [Bacteroidales bacterium]|nr:type II toxin-antitoxin system HicB family antitoxin [Bacteroidales bacterium]